MADDDRRTCFVLTTAAPAGTEIRNHTDGLIEYLVRPALSEAGYRTVRMDEVSEPGKVSDAVLRHLRNAEIVVADLSFADPTVMYALGVRHSFAMPVIHVRTPSAIFPFDLAGLRDVVIDLADMASIKRARRELIAEIGELAASSAATSPVLATLQLDELTHRHVEPAGDASPLLVNGIKAIEQRLTVMERLFSEARAATPESRVRSRRVFIVHGHDGELKHQLARMLGDLEFDVVILQELADSGRTLLDKLRGEIEDIGFVFVIFTPDDVAASRKDPDELRDRPRQNVVYEYGLFSGLLDPSRVCAIQRGDVELPSDLYGLVVKQIPEGAGIEAIQFDLVQELKRAGYDVDANQLMR